MTDRRHTIAIIGCGGVSRMHLDAYAAHPERVDIVAVCDPRHEARAARMAVYDVPRGFARVEDVVDEADFDVAVVCTPTPIRESVIAELAGAGKHIFCEKPLADSLDEAERIVALCDAAGVQLSVNQNFRYHYAFHTGKSLIQAGRVGEVEFVLHTDQIFRQDAGWRTQCERHALSVMGVHWLDGLRWMLDDEAARIHCTTQRSPRIDCVGETDAFIEIEFGGGATARFIESFSSDVTRADTHIWGSEGVLELGYEAATLISAGIDGLLTERCENPGAGGRKPDTVFWGLVELLTSLETGVEPANSGHDNLLTIGLLEGAYLSAACGEWVDFHEGGPLDTGP